MELAWGRKEQGASTGLGEAPESWSRFPTVVHGQSPIRAGARRWDRRAHGEGWGGDGLGEARSVCRPPARQGRCPLPQGTSSRMRTPGWEMFGEGQSVGSDGAQTTSALRSRAEVPPLAQQEPGL